MAWPDAMLLWDELDFAPPVRWTFARFAGYESQRGRRKWDKPMDAADIVDLQQIMGVPEGIVPPMFSEAVKWAEDMKKKHRMN